VTSTGPGRPAVRVRVPATSANLGPGFDAFGLALSRHDEVTVAVRDAGLRVEVSGEGADDVPRDESHLVAASLLTALRHWHGEPPGLLVRCRNTIPHGRGLGSSAAAIVAGVVAARSLLVQAGAVPEHSLGAADVLTLASRLEGHPDNVAAALAGGLTVAWQRDDGATAVSLTPHPQVLPVVCVPAWPMSTEAARGLLPDAVPHVDAAFNAGRAGLLVAALTRHPEHLLDATEDRLHQQYRAPAMQPTAHLVSTLRAHGFAAVVSGAGPTVLALCDGRQPTADAVAAVAGVAGEEWRVEALTVDLDGAVATPVPESE
jgi:homoserine kinase